MEKGIPIEATTKLVELLKPLPSEDRMRAIRAAMILLGDGHADVALDGQAKEKAEPQHDVFGTLHPRARTWMRQNDVSASQLAEVFHVGEGGVEVIASIPGRNKKEQTYNAYILTGLGQLLTTGNPTFADKQARAVCEAAGCYDSANHSVHLRNRGSEFAGTKDKGWTLTAPGLRRVAEIVKEASGRKSD
jgi:hypothetical protein